MAACSLSNSVSFTTTCASFSLLQGTRVCCPGTFCVVVYILSFSSFPLSSVGHHRALYADSLHDHALYSCRRACMKGIDFASASSLLLHV